MSFFKQFLPDYDKPSKRVEPSKRTEPTRQVASSSKYGAPITLSRVREALWDPEDEDDPYNPGRNQHATHDAISPSLDISPNARTAEEILQDTRAWLHGEILQEQGSVDWTPEFKFERVVLHPKGNELPQFSSPDELKRVSNASDLLIPVKRRGMYVDRAMLDRIQAGLGPRPSRIEDLVERLRIEPKTHSASDDSPYVEETYAELLAILQSWNTRVGRIVHVAQERDELVDALEERCSLIHEIETGDQNDILLAEQYMRLHRALHAFRPELDGFQDQNVFNQLVITIANHGRTNPEIDTELQELVIKTLFREYRSRIYFSHEHVAKRFRGDAEIELARLQEDGTEGEELAERRRKLDKESCNQASEEVLRDIQIAQKRLYGKVLEEVQSLAEQQAGQKWLACSITRTPASILAQDCIDDESELGNILQDWDLNVDDAIKVAIHSLQRISRFEGDNRRQVRKLAGLDVPRAERKAVMERRRKDYRTPLIMKEIQNQNSQIQDFSRRVVKRMEDVEGSLGYVLEAAGVSYRAHDRLLAKIDQEDVECLEPALYAVKDAAVGVQVRVAANG